MLVGGDHSNVLSVLRISFLKSNILVVFLKIPGETGLDITALWDDAKRPSSHARSILVTRRASLAAWAPPMAKRQEQTKRGPKDEAEPEHPHDKSTD